MRRLLLTAIPAVLALVIMVSPVGAGLQWCATDPIVELNGTEVQMWAKIPQQYEEAVNGPVEFTIMLPADVERETVFMDEGFNGQGETVTYVDLGQTYGDDFTVVVVVSIPFDENLLDTPNVPVQLEVIIDGESETYTGGFGHAFAAFNVESSN